MPKPLHTLALVPILALFAAGCGGGNGNATATVTGTVNLLQQIVLPPDAEVQVVLEDVSLQDAPAGLIAEQTIVTKGKQSPIAYSLEYNPKAIEEAHSYSVRAEILVGGERRFVSGQSYSVLTHGAPSTADVIVMALQAQAPAQMPLVGTHWALIELGGRAVAKTPTGREPHLMLLDEENRAVATGGCNQMSGIYRTAGASLTFSQFASTMKACPDGMDRDQALAQALQATANFRIDGSRLEIMNASGGVLARFDAATDEE